MSNTTRSPFRLRYRTMVLLLALIVILWSGFSYWSEYSENAARLARERLAPPMGVRCKVVLSSSELGLVRMPPTLATVNDSTDFLVGKIVGQSERWIVLATESADEIKSATYWIPRERVLLISVD